MIILLDRYIKKKYSKYVFLNKNKLKKNLKTKLNLKNSYFYDYNFIKNNYESYKLNLYSTYQNNFKYFKKNFNNKKYLKLLFLIKTNKLKTLNTAHKHITLNSLKSNFILNFILLYNFFLNAIYLDIFYFSKFLKTKNRIIFFLILSFKKKKLYINLQNLKKKTYLSISTGLFIKFFEKRKSIKKNKAIKLLMAKYLRKLFIISKITNLIMMIKKTPLFINELVNFLNLPIAHKFLNPIDQKTIDESFNKKLTIKFLYFIFTENKNFSKNKLPQKGRIKRKILRKVTFENKIVD
jgi:hypothetical protein